MVVKHHVTRADQRASIVKPTNQMAYSNVRTLKRKAQLRIALI